MEVGSMDLPKPIDLNRAIKIVIPSAIIVLAVLICVAAIGPFKRSLRSAGLSPSSVNAETRQPQPPSVRSTLKPEGFDPGSATCAAGQIQLVIENVSGTSTLALRLTRANGEVVGDYQLDHAYLLKQEVNLDAGNYTLKEVNHANWVFQITAQ